MLQYRTINSATLELLKKIQAKMFVEISWDSIKDRIQKEVVDFNY